MEPTKLLDQKINEEDGWKSETMSRLRKIVEEADPELKLEWKWGTAVWTKGGLVCALSSFKDHVKLNFFKGAMLKNHQKIFNAGLESKSNRSIDFYEGDKIDAKAIRELVVASVKLL